MFKVFPIFVALIAATAATVTAGAERSPNVVLIYADDLGFGDVSCNGGSIPTPNIDRLAKEGLRFTDAHASSATCTPSRFALLTGQYAFRQKGTGILPGDANLIIRRETQTLPKLFQRVGYRTAVVGKWHLGLGEGPIDWNAEIKPGPERVGFDYHFLLAATGDRTPCVYIEQNRVVGLDPADPIKVSYGERIDDSPSGKERPDLLKQRWSHGHDQTMVNGISRIGWMTGGENARWVDEDMADVLTDRAVKYVEQCAEQDVRFFLFFSTHDIHVPRVPHARFAGKSGRGPRGDVVLQLDWCVGQLMATLERLGVSDETMVIFTSDNGPVLDDGYQDQANELLGDHDANGPYRAGKYSLYEGGTRVPFVVRWPGRVAAGAETDALYGQVDLAASLAALIGSPIPEGQYKDSRDELDALLGADREGRPHLVHEAGRLALRVGDWKYIPPGQTRARLNPGKQQGIAEPGELYDLASEPGEKNDLASREPERLREMAALLRSIRSTPDRELDTDVVTREALPN